MNRRTWLGTLAGLLGLSATRRAEAETEPADFWSPKLIASGDGLEEPKEDHWFCRGELKLVQDADGMTCTLMQKWMDIRTGAIEWRGVPVELTPPKVSENT